MTEPLSVSEMTNVQIAVEICKSRYCRECPLHRFEDYCCELPRYILVDAYCNLFKVTDAIEFEVTENELMNIISGGD